MDETIKNVVEHVDYVQSIKKQKELIKLKYERKLIVAYNEGLFKATPELISFVKLYENTNYESVVIQDMNGNPIKIDQLPDFIVTLLERYHEIMNLYYVEYELLKNKRSIESLIYD